MKIFQRRAKPRLFLFLFLTLLSIFLLCDCKKSREGELSSAGGIERHVPLEEKALAEKLSAKGLIIRTFPTDGGYIRKTDQPIFIYFSQAIKPADFSFEILPPIKEWKVEWEREGKLAILQPGELFSVGVTYTLNLLISKPKTREKIEFTVYGPSSLDLIDRDEKEKIIDIDQAWIYRFQAIYESLKLPPKYKSITPITCATPLLIEFNKIKEKLKKETLEYLEPYLVPPTHPKSIFSAQLEDISDIKENTNFFPSLFAQDKNPSIWEKPIKCATAPIKIWFKQGQKEIAEEAKTYIDQLDMYNRFLKLMGKEPPSDENEQFNGGDGNLDICLAKIDHNGVCCRYKESKVTPSFILVKNSLRGNILLATLAHELFHSFQFAYDSYEEKWWLESTAVWAEDFIDRKHNDEQQYIPEAFHTNENRLETITDNKGLHPYGIYLFPFYLTQYHDKESVGAIWKRCGDTDALTAIDNEFKDFKRIFADFSYKCLDLGPTEGSFKDIGGDLFLWIHHRAKETILTSDVRKYEVEFTVPPLAAKYFFFRNRCDAEKTPHITFDLENIKIFEWLVVKAIIDPLGEAREEDWTGLSERSFCINREEEKFQQLAIVVASTDKTYPIETDITIEVEVGGCAEADLTADYSSKIEWIIGLETTKFELNVQIGATYKLISLWENKDLGEIIELYKLVSKNLYSFSGHGKHYREETTRDCKVTEDGSAVATIREVSGSERMLRIFYDSRSGQVKKVWLSEFGVNFSVIGNVTVTKDCKNPPEKFTFTYPFVLRIGWLPDQKCLLSVVTNSPYFEKASGNLKSKVITGDGQAILGPWKYTLNYALHKSPK